jgi:hypothetical protein
MKGARPKILFNREKPNGPPTGTSFDVVRGLAAGYVEVLTRSGDNRKAACKFIDKQLDALGFRLPNGARITATRVDSWRRSIDQTASAETMNVYNDMLSRLARLGMIPEEKTKPAPDQLKKARRVVSAHAMALRIHGYGY